MVYTVFMQLRGPLSTFSTVPRVNTLLTTKDIAAALGKNYRTEFAAKNGFNKLEEEHNQYENVEGEKTDGRGDRRARSPDGAGK